MLPYHLTSTFFVSGWSIERDIPSLVKDSALTVDFRLTNLNRMTYSFLLDALSLTDNIFAEVDHSKYTISGYQFLWSAYAAIHQKHSIPTALNSTQSTISSRKYFLLRRINSKLFLFLQDILLSLYSLISLFVLGVTKRSNLSVILTNDVFRRTLLEILGMVSFISHLILNTHYVEIISDASSAYSISNL